ncbi:AlpA family transcriptional regulator [Mangrovimicrobium sediminis]|uniref:AlpA family transcriptional regulator n=1 Tax=Mangrovimicrobium sediminis TaxID=2562682 RepID=A0A4Z0M4C9_9GAMM|nr:AlpA family transcriptional regulator [Haliea sp. SAOS-164]TGD74155.1 AlpA family transcriptional regulator [Haliea sp. SAOS-164]
MAQKPEDYRLLKLSEVEARTGKSRSSIYGDPEFPRPIKIGPRASAWVESEVTAWIESRIAARQAG